VTSKRDESRSVVLGARRTAPLSLGLASRLRAALAPAVTALCARFGAFKWALAAQYAAVSSRPSSTCAFIHVLLSSPTHFSSSTSVKSSCRNVTDATRTGGSKTAPTHGPSASPSGQRPPQQPSSRAKPSPPKSMPWASQPGLLSYCASAADADSRAEAGRSSARSVAKKRRLDTSHRVIPGAAGRMRQRADGKSR